MLQIPELQKLHAGNFNISIWLDSFNDIFSDFDSRPFHERLLSDDFISEARKMAKESPDDKIELHLLMPTAQRNEEIESVIIKSLHSHFRHISTTLSHEKLKIKKRGIIMSVCGFVLMILAAFLSNIEDHLLLIKTLRVVLEPACWFLVWTGLDQLYEVAYKKNPDYEFNTRMSHAKINFQSF